MSLSYQQIQQMVLTFMKRIMRVNGLFHFIFLADCQSLAETVDLVGNIENYQSQSVFYQLFIQAFRWLTGIVVVQ